VNRGEGRAEKWKGEDKEGRNGSDGEMKEKEKEQGGSDRGLT